MEFGIWSLSPCSNFVFKLQMKIPISKFQKYWPNQSMGFWDVPNSKSQTSKHFESVNQQDFEFGFWSLEFRIWSLEYLEIPLIGWVNYFLEFGVWSLEFAVWSLEFAIFHLEFEKEIRTGFINRNINLHIWRIMSYMKYKDIPLQYVI